MKVSSTIGFSAGILAASSIFSYSLGLVRDRLLAGTFGASAELDVFNAAFLVPDFIVNLFAVGLTAAFIPVFTELRASHNQTRVWQVTNQLLLAVACVMIVAAGLAIIAMPWLSLLVAPGFDDDSRALLILVSRVMMLSPIIFGISTVIGSALQGMRQFISYAASPVLYNLGIVLGIAILTPYAGILGAVYGVLIGAVLHMSIRCVELYYAGWSIRALPHGWWQPWKESSIRKTIKLMIPRMVGLITWQANLWIYTAIASGLAVGSIAVFNLARNFQSLPVSLFGIALATAAFPTLAQHFSGKHMDQFKTDVSKTVTQILYFTIPSAIGLAMLATPLVQVVLGTGAFTQEAVLTTGFVLSLFALSIPLESMQHIFARAFYARHDTVTPVIITLIATLVNGGVSVFASQLMGVAGLALGFIAFASTQVLLLAWRLHRVLHNYHGTYILSGLLKICLATTCMAGGVWLVSSLINNQLFTLGLSAICGTVIYAIVTAGLRMPEFFNGLRLLKTMLLKR